MLDALVYPWNINSNRACFMGNFTFARVEKDSFSRLGQTALKGEIINGTERSPKWYVVSLTGGCNLIRFIHNWQKSHVLSYQS